MSKGERVSIAPQNVEPELSFIKTYGVHAIVSLLLFGATAIVLAASYRTTSLSLFPKELLPFGLLVALAAVCLVIPLFLFLRQRALRRIIDATPVEPGEADPDRFFF